MTIEIIPADGLGIQELTDLYNQTRVDYMIPMPMDADRLAEYVHDFNVDPKQSWMSYHPHDGQRPGQN